jgi:DNA-binding NarL/FixJ family response regulator
MIHLLLADRHLLFRETLRRDLASEPDMQVVALAATGGEVMDQLSHTLIDIVLLDVQLASGLREGLELAADIQEACPATEVILLAVHWEENWIEQARKLGIAGMVSKGSQQEELLQLIRAIYRGETEFAILQTSEGSSSELKESELPALAFTFTERIVLQLLAEGFGPNQIAEHLGHRLHTIEVHRRNLLAKLGVLKEADLIVRAGEMGLIARKIL